MTAGVSRFGRRSEAGGAAALARVRFGVGSAIAYDPVYVAKEKGFFGGKGLEGARIALDARSGAGINSVKDLYGKKVGFQSGPSDSRCSPR